MNGNTTVIALASVLALIITIVGAVVLPLRASIEATNARIEREREAANDRIGREVEVIESRLEALDDKLQLEIAAADELSGERDQNQGDEFENAINAADEKLQAEIALVSSQTDVDIARVEERIKALRELVAVLTNGQ